MSIPADWKVERLAGALGAEITGLELTSVNDAELAALEQLLLEHLVLFFPGQHPEIAEHVAFGRRWGPLESHPHLKNPFTESNEVFELAASHGGIADEWHTDITFQERPAVLSILHMKQCPGHGGDTMWSNLYQAYDELSPPMQAMCEELTALHDAQPHNHPERTAVHPVVRVHPVTGRRCLYVNEHFTRRLVELNATESDALLPLLTRWVTNPRFTVRYRWSRGTVAIWDNRCTQHFVLNDFVGERIIQRVTVTGDKPEAARASRWRPWVRDGNLSATSRHDRQLHQHLKAARATQS